MYLLGLFVSGAVRGDEGPADLADLDFFPFPTLGTSVRRRGGARRPDRHLADGCQVAEPRGRAGRRQGVPRVLVEGLDPGHLLPDQPGVLIPTASDSDTSTYTDLQKKAVEIVSKAKRITQFLDRDTRPDFAGPNGMQRFLQNFLAKPDQDLAAYPEDHPGLLGPAAAALA